MNGTTFLVIMMAFISIIFNSTGDWLRKDDAMKVCQLSHSHDVCFQTLNR